MIRRLRLALARGKWPRRASFDAEAHRAAFDQVWWLVQFYYAVTLFIAYWMMSFIWETTKDGGATDPLWPVFWAKDIDAAGPLLVIVLIASAVLALLFTSRNWPRILIFLSLVTAVAYWMSAGQGSVNHGSHFWIWLGFVFCFLPSGSREEIRQKIALRHRYLLVFWAGLALILLFYTMSGFWKVAGAIEAIAVGRTSAFEPTALAIISAWTMLLDKEPTILGPLIANYPWIGWPFHLGVVYIELFAFLIAFRPSLHRLWGLILIGFHVGTFLVLGISFPQHMFVLTLLLIWSPFAMRQYSFSEMAQQLPLFGWLWRPSEAKARQTPDLPPAGQATLIYDGECPFCSRYAAMVHLRKRYDLKLVNARKDSAIVNRVLELGFILDHGMVLEIDGRYYHGDECLFMLALMGADEGLLSKLAISLLGRPAVAAWVYPILTSGRSLTLSILRRSKLGY